MDIIKVHIYFGRLQCTFLSQACLPLFPQSWSASKLMVKSFLSEILSCWYIACSISSTAISEHLQLSNVCKFGQKLLEHWWWKSEATFAAATEAVHTQELHLSGGLHPFHIHLLVYTKLHVIWSHQNWVINWS